MSCYMCCLCCIVGTVVISAGFVLRLARDAEDDTRYAPRWWAIVILGLLLVCLAGYGVGAAP